MPPSLQASVPPSREALLRGEAHDRLFPHSAAVGHLDLPVAAIEHSPGATPRDRSLFIGNILTWRGQRNQGSDNRPRSGARLAEPPLVDDAAALLAAAALRAIAGLPWKPSIRSSIPARSSSPTTCCSRRPKKRSASARPYVPTRHHERAAARGLGHRDHPVRARTSVSSSRHPRSTPGRQIEPTLSRQSAPLGLA